VTEAIKKLGVGVIGLGVGEQHALAYADHDACELRWLYDLSTDQADAVKARVGHGDIADSYEAILADDDVDIVSIATFDHLHADAVKAAFIAGKHVFVEKPLCRTMPELQSLSDAWNKASRPHLASNLVLREAPLYAWLRSAIADGTLGDLYAIDGDYLYGRLEKITGGWRGDVPDYSVMEGGGIHLIDLMMELSGQKPDTAATTGNKIATRDTEFRYDDFMATTFTFPSGLIGRITANFGCMHRHHHIVRVFGTKATFIYDDQGPRMMTSRNEDSSAEALDLSPLPAGKGVLIPAFVDDIVAGVDPAPAAEKEFNLIAVTAAADKAMASETPITIEYLT